MTYLMWLDMQMIQGDCFGFGPRTTYVWYRVCASLTRKQIVTVMRLGD